MRSTRRTTNRKGFTLIELLIVVVIIGILAAVAIPKFSNTKQKAQLANVKSDLKNLVSVEEAYFADKNAYGDINAIKAAPYSFVMSDTTAAAQPSIAAGATGWSATVTSAAAGGAVCTIFSGSGTEAGTNKTDAKQQDGVPTCK